MTDSKIRDSLISAREEYVNLIKSELLGPGSEFGLPDYEHELISSSPLGRYSIGILYPQGNQVNQDNDETLTFEESEGEDPYENRFENDLSKDNPTDQSTSRNTRNYEFDETADENLDEEIGLSTQYMPSSMGITFLVKGNTDIVNGKVSFGTYRKAKLKDCSISFIAPDAGFTMPEEFAGVIEYDDQNKVLRLLEEIQQRKITEILNSDSISEENKNLLKQYAYRLVGFLRSGFVREPHNEKEFELNFSKNDYVDDNKNIDGTSAKITALRTKIDTDTWSLTIMLVNDNYDNEKTVAKAVDCLYQPVLQIASEDNGFAFVESNAYSNPNEMDSEERSLSLLYREKKNYGTGLGVSIDWEIDKVGKGILRSEYFPSFEVPPMDFNLPTNNKLENKHLSMKYLSDLDITSKEDKLRNLKSLVDLYKEWVNGLKDAVGKLDSSHQSAAKNNISECEKAYERMYLGIKMLEKDDYVYSAFVLANRAMFMQRVHLRMQSETSNIDRYPGDEEIQKYLTDMDYNSESDQGCIWRPFQIAFLLMDITSIVDEESPERDIVDLIWFPTGGGKTEAYLGLTAFTIFYRRLKNLADSGGTSVIMRYTLRLLAAQQFTRAATLICACEYIRQDCESGRPIYPCYSLGKEQISIGLWIGGSHIPNTNVEARKCIKKLLGVVNCSSIKSIKDRYNKFQVLKCPWCGTKLVKDGKNKTLVGAWGYKMRDNNHFYMSCTHESCAFRNKLPIQIIDDELYENPPTLLFGTVDKFAMLPWDGRVGAFFASGNTNRSPELIIQDELHLISGALGTIVGLYETAIDAICSQKGIRPKIIASTATIRRAKEQCSVLYNREVVQFPAPGLNAEDSFFAREAKISYEKGIFGRKYVGLFPAGKTKAMMEIRTMAALLQQIYMMELDDEVKDKFWTLTIYFNSLRDLGKAATLVEDDVKDFIIRTANRLFAWRRLIVGSDELTSRVTTTELNETLDKLEKLEYSQENIDNKRYASNVLLATNMISVGIDVARLNVMLIVGQPKLTSEYIQASSRIGRSFPGVAFVQYDATKSRDRSHYERFRSYHESFYRFVESTGATPFSKPARERALHAVITAMVRQFARMDKDKDAIKVDEDSFDESVRRTKQFILNRIEQIGNRANIETVNDVEDIRLEIETFVSEWRQWAKEAKITNGNFYFGRGFMVKSPSDNEGRLLKQYNSTGKDNSRETLTSMRNVDTPVLGEILLWEDN